MNAIFKLIAEEEISAEDLSRVQIGRLPTISKEKLRDMLCYANNS